MGRAGMRVRAEGGGFGMLTEAHVTSNIRPKRSVP